MNTKQIDLNHFYSNDDISVWKKVIGEHLHFHHGYFKGHESLEEAAQATIRSFYPYIPQKASVLDAGCGWGGPAKMLIEEKECEVKAFTISDAQAAYCRSIGVNASVANLESLTFQEGYDVIFSIEVLSHIQDKAGLLRKFRQAGNRLVLSVNCMADYFDEEMLTYGDSMILCRVADLIKWVEDAGWTIEMKRDRRFMALKTHEYWHKNLKELFGDKRPHGQFGDLYDQAISAFSNLLVWARNYPLIDIVAN